MDNCKKVKVITIEPANRGILELNKVYEVIREKRDEYLLHVDDGVMCYIWRDHAEIVKDGITKSAD
jgi:hypothetical protein